MDKQLSLLILLLGAIWILVNEYTAKQNNNVKKQYITNFVGGLFK